MVIREDRIVETTITRARGSSGDDVYEALHDALLRGELKPGDRIREAEIAATLNVSRTPVREALQRLEAAGVLVHEPRKGASIRRLDQQAVTELYLLRTSLEGLAAYEAVKHASNEEIETLQDMIDSADPGATDPVWIARSNHVFHRAIRRAAHNRFLVLAMESLSATMSLLGRTTLATLDRAQQAADEHQTIVSAIAARDADAAREAAEQHIKEAHRARLKQLFEAELEEEAVV